MSESVSALSNASFSGGIAEVGEVGPQGMITLRGDLSSGAVKKAATSVTGLKMPKQGGIEYGAGYGLCWMSPDELLVLCPYEKVSGLLNDLTAALGAAHALAVDVSDARAVFRVSGAEARDVMGKLAPVDFAPGAFEPGMFRRSRLAQVPAAFWMRDSETFEIVCFRSAAQYMFDLLTVAAAENSSVHVY